MEPNSAIKKGKRFVEIVIREVEAEGLGKAVPTPGSGSGKKKGDVFCSTSFLMECKNEKQTNFLPNIDQSKEQARIGNKWPEKWALITMDPRTPEANPEIYATIDFWQFLKLLKKNREPLVKEPDRQFAFDCKGLKIYVDKVLKHLK